MDSYSSIKRNEVLLHVITWMDLEIMLGEISQTQKEKQCLILLTLNKYLLLLLSRFSRVRLCATPQTAAHQVPQSLGFYRQEHEWVAISFSNAWKWSRSVVSNSSRPHGLQPTRLLHPWDFPGNSIGVGRHGLLQINI